MGKLVVLVKTSRPLGWAIAPLVFLIGFSFSPGGLTFLPILQILLLSFPYCIFLYGINDIYDYKSDKLNPRKKLLEGIKLEPRYHSFIKRVSIAVVFLLVTSSLLTFNISNILGILLLLFFSYFYSAPPLQFKERPPLDSLSNGILYFFAPFVIGYSFGNSFFTIPLKIYLTTVCAMGLHSFSTIMDYSADKKVGDKTFSVVLGKRSAAIFAFFLFTFILLFARFESAAITYYLLFCSLLFSITAIHPSEKLASSFFKLIFAGFIITAMAFLA